MIIKIGNNEFLHASTNEKTIKLSRIVHHNQSHITYVFLIDPEIEANDTPQENDDDLLDSNKTHITTIESRPVIGYTIQESNLQHDEIHTHLLHLLQTIHTSLKDQKPKSKSKILRTKETLKKMLGQISPKTYEEKAQKLIQQYKTAIGEYNNTNIYYGETLTNLKSITSLLANEKLPSIAEKFLITGPSKAKCLMRGEPIKTAGKNDLSKESEQIIQGYDQTNKMIITLGKEYTQIQKNMRKYQELLRRSIKKENIRKEMSKNQSTKKTFQKKRSTINTFLRIYPIKDLERKLTEEQQKLVNNKKKLDFYNKKKKYIELTIASQNGFIENGLTQLKELSHQEKTLQNENEVSVQVLQTLHTASKIRGKTIGLCLHYLASVKKKENARKKEIKRKRRKEKSKQQDSNFDLETSNNTEDRENIDEEKAIEEIVKNSGESRGIIIDVLITKRSLTSANQKRLKMIADIRLGKKTEGEDYSKKYEVANAKRKNITEYNKKEIADQEKTINQQTVQLRKIQSRQRQTRKLLAAEFNKFIEAYNNNIEELKDNAKDLGELLYLKSTYEEKIEELSNILRVKNRKIQSLHNKTEQLIQEFKKVLPYFPSLQETFNLIQSTIDFSKYSK